MQIRQRKNSKAAEGFPAFFMGIRFNKVGIILCFTSLFLLPGIKKAFCESQNRLLVFLPLRNPSVEEGAFLTFKVNVLRALDFDPAASYPVTYTTQWKTAAPKDAGFSRWLPGTFIWQTKKGDAGKYPVVLCANDRVHKACQEITIEVKKVTPSSSSGKGSLMEERKLSKKVCDFSGDPRLEKACALLQEAYEAGAASGHESVWKGKAYYAFYENLDKGHSVLNPKFFPQLRYLQSSDKKKALPEDLPFSQYVKISNSSTAEKVRGFLTTQLISYPRLFSENADMMNELYEKVYSRNQIMVFPAVNDFEEANPPKDLFMGNVLFTLITKGRSGSDIPFVKAVYLFLAALSPELKAKILEGGYFVPVFQMALRRCMKGIETLDDYLSHAGHPVALDGDKIDYERLVQFAFEMNRLNRVPPVSLISISGEDFALDEALYTTPAAIGRVWRHFSPDRKNKNIRNLILDGRTSFDPEGNALVYQWVILQGRHPDLVLTPLNEENSVIRIAAPYQNLRTEIALFTKTQNGEVSAPAIVSLSNEVRGDSRSVKGPS